MTWSFEPLVCTDCLKHTLCFVKAGEVPATAFFSHSVFKKPSPPLFFFFTLYSMAVNSDCRVFLLVVVVVVILEIDVFTTLFFSGFYRFPAAGIMTQLLC